MQTSFAHSSKWFFLAKSPEPGVPSRVSIKAPFRVGRREGFDLCLNCRNVSGLHAELMEEDGKLFVEDLNSTNGTFVNGIKIRVKTELNDGDTVQFGLAAFTVELIKDDPSSLMNLGLDPSTMAKPETTEDRFARLLDGGVVPFFQPIYNINGKEDDLIGYEVLGRSRLFGLKTPKQMFAVATDLEKESELSRILRLRGIEAAEASLPKDAKLFVNTHPAELDCEEIHQSLKVIRATFPEREIFLELPELVLYETEAFEDLFDAAKELNVQLVIHDFGAGQIRLAELSRMNPDVVKFDCALTQNIHEADEQRQKLVSAMAKMTNELGIIPMAEYVECSEEHDMLKEMGFHLVQGYHYGHPTSIEAFNDTAELLEDGKLADFNASKNRPLEILSAVEPNIIREEVISDLVSESDELGFDDFDFEDEDLAVEEVEITEVAINQVFIDEVKKFKDADWLLTKEPDTFTLQLMFTTKREEAEAFVNEQDQSGDYVIYRKLSSDIEWHVVAYGHYTDRDSAKADTAHFADSGHSCWVRKMSDVHQEIQSVTVVVTEDTHIFADTE